MDEDQENEHGPTGIAWRYSGMRVRVGPFDASILFPPTLFFLVNIEWWTACVALGVVGILWIIEVFLEMPISIVRRSIRSSLAGSIRSTIPWWRRNNL